MERVINVILLEYFGVDVVVEFFFYGVLSRIVIFFEELINELFNGILVDY